MEPAGNMDNTNSGNGEVRSVKVEYYAGYRGRETPRRLLIEGRPVPVLEVLSRKRVQDQSTGDRIEVFTLRLPRSRVTLRVFEDGRAEIGRRRGSGD